MGRSTKKTTVHLQYGKSYLVSPIKISSPLARITGDSNKKKPIKFHLHAAASRAGPCAPWGSD